MKKEACYDCGSTIHERHTPLCDLAESEAVMDLPSKLGTQWWIDEMPESGRGFTLRRTHGRRNRGTPGRLKQPTSMTQPKPTGRKPCNTTTSIKQELAEMEAESFSDMSFNELVEYVMWSRRNQTTEEANQEWIDSMFCWDGNQDTITEGFYDDPT